MGSFSINLFIYLINFLKNRPPFCQNFQKFKLKVTKMKPWSNTCKCISCEQIDDKKLLIIDVHLVYIFLHVKKFKIKTRMLKFIFLNK
jgi:hypothetical protein